MRMTYETDTPDKNFSWISALWAVWLLDRGNLYIEAFF